MTSMLSFRGFGVIVAQALLVALLPSCSDDSSDSNDEARVCNDLVNDAPEVTYDQVSTAAPTPVGGTIAEGEYVISALRIYSQTRPAPPSVVKAVMSIAGTTMQQVGDRDGEERRYTSTFTVSGTTVSIKDTCPQSNLDTPSFTATPTSLSLFSESQGEVFEIEFTKR